MSPFAAALAAAVPDVVLVGAAGSAKLAHAVSLHGLQVLALLALLLGRSGLTPRGRTLLRAEASHWDRYVGAVGRILRAAER